MPYAVNIPESADYLEVYADPSYDQPRIDPAAAQQYLKNRFRLLIQEELQRVLEWEAAEQIQAERYERQAPARQDYRNGYRSRGLATHMGMLQLQVPRARNRSLVFSVFAAYQRRWQEVDALLLEAYIGGMSCRTAADRLGQLLGIPCSGATVAELIRHLEEGLRAFRSQPLSDEYVALIIDGMYVRIKQCGPRKRPVVAVVGIKADGGAELLSFRVCYSENSIEVEGILRDLKERGVQGGRLELVTIDGNRGLESAVRAVFGLVRIQSCVFHRINRLHQNAKGKKRARQMMQEASKAFAVPDVRGRRRALKAFCHRWRPQESDAIRCFEDQLERCFEADVLPEPIRSKASTTSLCETLFGQMRHRLNKIGAFETPRAVELFVLATVKQKTWIHIPGALPNAPLIKSTHSF